jgi:hypothetical protein
MAASYNPYEAPGTSGYGSPRTAEAGGSITPLMVEHMRGARPWVRLLAILCFVGAGFMVLAAGMMFLGGLVGLAASGRSRPGADALIGPIGGIMYLFMAGFYVIPGVLMHRFAGAIDSFVTVPSSSSLEDALDKSRGYWKFCGIMALVMIGFAVLVFFGAIAAGVIAGLAAKP